MQIWLISYQELVNSVCVCQYGFRKMNFQKCETFAFKRNKQVFHHFKNRNSIKVALVTELEMYIKVLTVIIQNFLKISISPQIISTKYFHYKT